MTKMWTLLFGIISFLFVLGCNEVGPVSGGGSHTGNGTVLGNVTDIDGVPLGNADINLIPIDYNPLEENENHVMKKTTGRKGQFAFHDIPDDVYNIEGHSKEDGTKFLLTNVRVESDLTQDVGEVSMKPLKRIKLDIPEALKRKDFSIYIKGTTQSLQVKELENDSVAIDVVAYSSLPEIQYVSENKNIEVPLREKLYVTFRDTQSVVESYELWRHKSKIILNTTASGADIQEDLEYFPVFVRVQQNPFFKFSQAKADGSDIRFVDDKGENLSYELDYWNPSEKRGVFWVQVPLIRKNNLTQYITMYWGNERVENRSEGTEVFRQTNGYEGVWHMTHKKENGRYLPFKNSVGEGNEGVVTPNMSITNGIVGDGLDMKHNNYMTVYNTGINLRPSTYLSASIWVNTTSSSTSELLSMGDDYGLRLMGDGRVRSFIYDNNDVKYNVMSDVKINNGERNLISMVYNGSSLRLYVNGVLEKTTFNVPKTINYNLGENLRFGAHGELQPGFYLTGELDEARISSTVRSSAWYRLSYINQRLPHRWFIHQKP